MGREKKKEKRVGRKKREKSTGVHLPGNQGCVQVREAKEKESK